MELANLILNNCVAMSQLSTFISLVLNAQDSDMKLDFSNISEPIHLGFSMQYEFIMVGGLTLLYVIILLYIIPLKIAVDEENPMRWYYPCVCGCFRRNRHDNT